MELDRTIFTTEDTEPTENLPESLRGELGDRVGKDKRLTSWSSTATIFTTEDTEPTECLLEISFPSDLKRLALYVVSGFSRTASRSA